MEEIIGEMSKATDGCFEEIASTIKRLGWEILTMDIDNDVFRIFSLGDYRIEQYMKENNRSDY